MIFSEAHIFWKFNCRRATLSEPTGAQERVAPNAALAVRLGGALDGGQGSGLNEG